MKSKREKERHSFEQFRKAEGLEATPDYGDRPDIILPVDNRKVGVEITHFYIRPGSDVASEQRQREQRQGVLSAAQRRYRDVGARRLQLTIEFNPQQPIRSKRKAALIDELVALASRIEGLPAGRISPLLFEQSPELWIVWLNPSWEAAWSTCQTYSVDFISADTLSSIVREKEAKLVGYQTCDTYWLLVVIDLADSAQDQEIRGTSVAISSVVFERIILYKPQFNEIIDIKM